MRLFTGLSLPAEVTAKLTRLECLAALRRSSADNLHITTKFIGEWPDARLGELAAALNAIPKAGTIPVRVEGLDFYPNAQKPKVLFAGVKADGRLQALAGAAELTLERLGCAREQREYSPHVTLARVGAANVQGLRETIASMTDFQFGSFEATEFHLYLSKPSHGGSVYTKLASYPLA